MIYCPSKYKWSTVNAREINLVYRDRYRLIALIRLASMQTGLIFLDEGAIHYFTQSTTGKLHIKVTLVVVEKSKTLVLRRVKFQTYIKSPLAKQSVLFLFHFIFILLIFSTNNNTNNTNSWTQYGTIQYKTMAGTPQQLKPITVGPTNVYTCSYTQISGMFRNNS